MRTESISKIFDFKGFLIPLIPHDGFKFKLGDEMTMMRFVLALGCALLAAPAPAAASFAVVCVTADRIVAASDSRTWHQATDTPGPDDARKVDVREGVLLAMTGSPEMFQAWQSVTPRLNESMSALADRVLAAVRPDDRRLEFAAVIARHGTPIDAIALRVEVPPGGRLVVLQRVERDRLTPPFVIGLGLDDAPDAKDALLQRLNAELRTAPDEPRMVTLATAAVATAAAASRKIGGATHTAVVDQAGARWHTRADDVHWDGSNLALVSANLTIDANGIRINPGTAESIGTAFSFNTGNTGGSGLFGREDPGTIRQVRAVSEWAGTGNYAGQIGLSLQSRHTPSSGGTSKESSIFLGSSSSSSTADISAETTNFSTDLQVRTDNGTTSIIPYIRGNGSQLYIESRSAANGGSLSLNNDQVANVFTAFGGGSTFINNARFTGAPLWESGLSQTTVGASGAASALPALPAGYLKVLLNGVPYVVPFYAP